MSIAAHNVAPNYAHRRSLSATELQRLSEPCVIFEHEGLDSDFAPYWVYTIGGWLDGEPLMQGCTTAGDVIVISGMTCREDADAVATLGLQDTLQALDKELTDYRKGKAALDRLSELNPVQRLELATKPASDKSDSFVDDIDAIRPLIGDDILLAAGEVSPGAH